METRRLAAIFCVQTLLFTGSAAFASGPEAAIFKLWSGSKLHWGSPRSAVEAALASHATTELRAGAIFVTRGKAEIDGCTLEAKASGLLNRLSDLEMTMRGPETEKCFGKFKDRLSKFMGEPRREVIPNAQIELYAWRHGPDGVDVRVSSEDPARSSVQILASNPEGSLSDIR